MAAVAIITAYDGQGRLLFGRRKDNKKWTLPGGHANPGEDPRATAVRELHEETGLHPSSLSYLHEDLLPSGDPIYFFSAHVRGEPHGNFDPDEECSEWKFVDIAEGIPSKIWNNLHGPEGDENIVRNVFQWEEAPVRPEQQALDKAEPSGPSEPSDLHKQPLGYFCPHGLQVFFVNGEYLRDHVDSDFVQGGNPFRYKWVPQNEIWVDNDTPKQEVPYVILHECKESERMRAGEGYDKAHDEAKGIEDHARAKDEAAGLEKATPKMWTSDDWGTAQISIPSQNHPERTQYDSNYLDAIKDHYGSVTPVKVPIVGLSFRNDIKNKPRYDLYRKMVRAGDRLPPAVVRRTSSGFEVLDGNHKGQAARDEGAKTLDAVEVPGELSKAEDEVSRLLDHPDLKERSLALKLDSVTPKHLQTASLDPHPEVHEAAINHRMFGNEQIMHLMEAKQGTDGAYPLTQQLHVLSQPDRVRGSHIAAVVKNSKTASPTERDRVLDHVVQHTSTPEAVVRALYLDPETGYKHREKLLTNLNAPHDVLEHALQTGMLVPSVEADGLAKLAVKHPHVPTSSIDGLVRMAVEKGAPHVREIAQYALRNSVVSPETADRVFSEAKMKPGAESGTMLAALLAGPTDHDGALVGRAMQELKPEMWQHAVSASKLTPGDFSRLVSYAHGTNNGDLRAQLSNHPMFGPQHMQQLLNKAEVLAKSVDPKHFSSIVRALDPEAHKLVDHEPDLRAHPKAHGAEVEAYKNHVLSGDEKRGPRSSSQAGIGSGITRKKVFQYKVSGQKDPGKAMVKPYHERVIRRVKGWMKHPIQGWAEMTHQALYHAAGIGHLHQKVHVAEHDMGPGHEKEPALVVHLAPNHRSVLDGSFAAKDENAGDYRKIAMMDFLSNNKDRHSGNLLVNQETGAPLAVDHSRSFQYISPKESVDPNNFGDTFGQYHRDTAMDDVFPFMEHGGWQSDKKPLYERQRQTSNDYDPVFDWWGEVGNGVRKSFHDRLDQIKDPKVRSHLKRNFDARADWLDERAKFGIGNYGKDWYHDHVPMYKPGELTDEEKEDLHRGQLPESEYQRWLASKPDDESNMEAREKWYAQRPKDIE